MTTPRCIELNKITTKITKMHYFSKYISSCNTSTIQTASLFFTRRSKLVEVRETTSDEEEYKP
jgi:hypothetical protein